MKLERIPVAWSEPDLSELSEYELYDHYEDYLGQLDHLRRLFIRTEEIPDILVEAAAFRLGCNDHETCLFGWTPWEVDDPDIFVKLRLFIERTGQYELVQEVLNFEEKLLQFGVENARYFFAHDYKKLSDEISDGINEVVSNGFDHTKFGEDIWLKTARAGAKLVEDANIFHYYPDFKSVRQALRTLVDTLPDYESRIQEKTMWRVGQPFHALLTGVGERYFHDKCVKMIRNDGSLSLNRDAHKYDELAVFDDASRIYLLTSTQREWLCCQVGSTAWLVDPNTGEKRASAPVSARKSD